MQMEVLFLVMEMQVQEVLDWLAQLLVLLYSMLVVEEAPIELAETELLVE
jgi:TRAP-type C4-dicarboxylate transport system permease small subunit